MSWQAAPFLGCWFTKLTSFVLTGTVTKQVLYIQGQTNNGEMGTVPCTAEVCRVDFPSADKLFARNSRNSKLLKKGKVAAAQKSVPSTEVRRNIASKTIAAATATPATATATAPAPTQTLLQKHAA